MKNRPSSPTTEPEPQQITAIRVLVCAETDAAAGSIIDVLKAVSPAQIEPAVACGEETTVSTIRTDPVPVAVIHCDAHSGLTDAVLRQSYLLKLCAARRVLLAVADDERGADTQQFATIATQFREFAARAGIGDAETLPLARLAERISGLAAAQPAADSALRLRVTAATPLAQRRWRCHGAIECGALHAGQAVTAFPAEKRGEITQLDDAMLGPSDAHRSVAFAVETEARLKAGDLLAAGGPMPDVSDQIAAHLVWTATQRLYPGRKYLLRTGNETVAATVTALKHRVDPRTLEPLAARFLESGEIGFCNLSLDRPVVFDRDPRFHATHRFRLLGRNGERELAAGFPAYGLRRATNLTRQEIPVQGAARAAMKEQQPCVLWFTGLSGAGKSSTASAVDQQLHAIGRHTYLLDGDNVRHGLSRDLGFTEADRVENIRRVAEVARLMVDAGLIVLVSFISPFRSERRMARELFEDGRFIEVFMDTPLPVCEARDMKGLYRKARAGELVNFTGIDSPYEEPETPELRLRPADGSPEAQAVTVIDFLRDRGMI